MSGSARRGGPSATSAGTSTGTSAGSTAGGSAVAGRRAQVLAVAALVGATLFWAGNYVVGPTAVAATGPLSLVWLRWLLALPLLVLVAQLLERPDWRAVARAWRWVLALGATGLAGYTLLLYAALRLTTPLDAAIVNAVNPALIVLAAVALLGERVTARGLLGVAVAFAGVVVVLTDGRPAAALTGGVNGGDLLMLGAISTWTAYTVIGRRGPRLPPVASTAAQALVVVVGLAPVVAVAGLRLPGDAVGGWALAFIVLLPSVGSYVLWNTALRTVPPSRAGVYLNLITVFTAAATALLGHPLSAAQLVGGAVVLAGVALTTTATPRRPSPPRP